MNLIKLLPIPALAALLACGGSRAAPQGTSLAYAGPADAAAWRFVQDPASTGTRLVLDLLAPAGTSGAGVTLVLSADPARAAWSSLGDGPVASDAYAPPLTWKTRLAGPELGILLSQGGASRPVAYGAAPVLRVALELRPGAPQGDAGLAVADAGHLTAPGTLPVPVTVQVGTLAVR